MKNDLKKKTINGFFWSLIESVFSQGQGMIFGVILARLLSPEEFGLIGMITIFISIAQVFVDSGLSPALIRKQNCDNIDYSTVFWANAGIGVLSYLAIWLIAPSIASFYSKPVLTELTRVTSFSIIIGSLTLIQQTILTKDVDFKVLTKISTIGTFVSGIVSIVMAYYGYGVWSLVWRSIINQLIRSILLWRHNNWIPQKNFSVKRFKELFGFGSNILFITLIAVIFKNVYYMIIGKNYSNKVLGYYTNADQYCGMISNTISSITSKVTYPILASVQDDNAKLKPMCRQLTNTVMYVSFFVMFGLVATAVPLFTLLFGAKWHASIKFFQILCVAYSISPLLIINMNVMKIKGRSDLFLRTEIIKYAAFVPIIIIGIIYGLTVLIVGIVIFYWGSFFISAMYTKRLINYSMTEQFADCISSLALCLPPAIIILLLGHFFPFNTLIILFLQGFLYLSVVLMFSILFKFPAYLEIKQIAIRKFNYTNYIKNLKSGS